MGVWLRYEQINMSSTLVVRRPSSVLAQHVDLLWHDGHYAASSHRERIIPPASFTLTIELETGAASFNGVRSTYIELDTARIHCVVGVLFRPGGWRPFVDTPGEELYNTSISLSVAWGSSAASRLCDRLREPCLPEARLELLENELLRVMRPHVVLHPAVEQALREFQRAPHVGRVAPVVEATGLSRGWFSKLFREQVGVTPKVYCRLRRFHRVVHEITRGIRVDWAEVAAAGGYSDQAHLAHEFQAFCGLSPRAFLKAERPSGAHVKV
jgi:AraC-like DNA-binding protein